MPDALLATKLHIPRLRRDLVHRQRLMERLDTGLRGKLTLVSAPAGYGKTTLMADWIGLSKAPTAWLSLDEADNDPARFLTYVIAALQWIDESIGLDVQVALAESQTLPGEALLTRLVNDIAAASDPSGSSEQGRGDRGFVLVLDDYHLITAQPVHDALNFLLEQLPEAMHLLVVGRSDPPLPISRLRVQGEIIEIRTPELRFTGEEAATFLNDLMGLGLSSGDVAALEARTEGWIASLQLAALSLQGRPDKHEFVASFSGSHRYVIDYLIDEVLSRQPAAVQAFLLQTSILKRFCASLCDAVSDGGQRTADEGESSLVPSTGSGQAHHPSSHSQAILEQLERTNLFLIPLDDERRWYRYHHLFADFLQQRLRQREPEQIPDLHRRSSQWFEDEGLVDEAIQHALTAEDLKRATRLVSQIAATLVVRREPNKLLRLVDQLPPEMCQDQPMLCIWHAWALLFAGQLDEVEPALQIVEAQHGQDAQPLPPGYATTIRAYLANQWGNLREAVDLTQQALEQLSEAPPGQTTLIFKGAAVIWLGVNLRFQGDMDQAVQLFAEAAALNRKAGNYYGALAALEQSADLARLQEKLYRAVEIYQQGLELAQRWSEQEIMAPQTMMASSGLHLGLGSVLYQWNDLAAAAPHLRRAAELEELGESWNRVYMYRMLAYLKQANGGYEGAHDLLRQACAIRDRVSIRQYNVSVQPSLEQLRILLSRTDPKMRHLLLDAVRRIEALDLDVDDDQVHRLDFSDAAHYAREADYADLARVLVATGRPAEALPLLDRLLKAAQSMGRLGDAIRYLVLQALALRATGDTASALASLNKALTLAEPEGYVRVFVDEGEPMAELLHAVSRQKPAVIRAYIGRLLAALGATAPSEAAATSEPVPKPAPTPSLIEPLSEREFEVLRLMAAGLKHKEIAEELVISLNTVRHHARNIYGKLGVHSRAQAVAKAEELNLL